MPRTRVFLVLTLLTLGVFSACSEADPLTNTTDDLTSEMAEVALESDRMTEEIVQAELATMGQTVRAVTMEKTFSGTRPCPEGGELTVEGSIVRMWDSETGVMEASISGSRTRTDCVFARGDRTITVNGGSMWDKFRRRVDGVPDGLQTSHYSGSWVAVSSAGAPMPRSSRAPTTAPFARRPRVPRASAIGAATRWTRPTPARRCARCGSTSRRAPMP